MGINSHVTTDMSLLTALTRLQGVGACECLPDEDVDRLRSSWSRSGSRLTVTSSGIRSDTIGLCDAWLASNELPDDVELLRIGPDTPLNRLQEVADLVASVDMMLPMESFVRGQAVSSVYYAAIDRNGLPVAHASTTRSFHPDAPNGEETHWGMLATAHHRRGEGMALYLGALALTKLHREYGFTGFVTGIRAGMCRRRNSAAGWGLPLAGGPSSLRSTRRSLKGIR